MSSPRQLLLDLPHRTALGRDDFLISPSNVAAVKLIDEWPNWPAHAALLIGPEGSGKSHLAHVWQAKAQAPILNLAELTVGAVPQLLSHKALCLEQGYGLGFEETALFHALNYARQNGCHVLLTSQTGPSLWGVKLPDLASRLNALPIIHIQPPDDGLLRGVLVKLFDDRQIVVDDNLVSYMITRMPRSLAAARRLVEAIDRQAMMEKTEITKMFVGRVMASFESPDLLEDNDL